MRKKTQENMIIVVLFFIFLSAMIFISVFVDSGLEEAIGWVSVFPMMFLGGLVIALFFYPIFFLPTFSRMLRMRIIARKFGLYYKSNIKFIPIYPKRHEFNMMEGKLNGENIKVFDLYMHDNYTLPFRGKYGEKFYFGKRQTILEYKNHSGRIKSGLFGYARTSFISRILMKIKNGEDVTNDLKDTESVSFNIFILLYVLLFVLAVAIALL